MSLTEEHFKKLEKEFDEMAKKVTKGIDLTRISNPEDFKKLGDITAKFAAMLDAASKDCYSKSAKSELFTKPTKPEDPE